MNKQMLNKSLFNETTGGKYYPDHGIWIWDRTEELIGKKITEQQFEAMLSLASCVAKLWDKQRGNTYDSSIEKTEIEEALRNNSFFASHFSVSKKVNGELISQTYLEAYPEETSLLIDTIEDILNNKIFEENPGLVKYLHSVMNALKGTSYSDRKPAEWMQCDIDLATQSDTLFMYLHPTESYWDKTQEKYPEISIDGDDPWKYFFEAKGYLCNPIVTDEYVERVKNYILGKYKDIITSNSHIAFIDMLIIAGGNASYPNRGQNIPNDPEIRANYGKQIYMYANTILYKGEYQFLPYKQKYIVYSLVTDEEFINAGLSHTLNHEIAHNAERFTSTQWLEEMKASLLSLHNAAGLEAEGLLGTLRTTRNAVYESEIVNHLDLFVHRKEHLPRYYYIGENIMLNYWLQYGALKLHSLSDGQKIEIDYDKMEQAINGLTDELLILQDQQSLSDFTKRVEDFKSKYFDERIYLSLGLDQIPEIETATY